MKLQIILLALLMCIAPGLTTIEARQAAPASQAASGASAEVYKNVYNGWKWWHVYCYRCHGMNAVGGNLAPNLIDPNEKIALKDFLFIVRNGSADGQMQAWDKLLDDKQITQLYYYVMARKDKILPPGRPDEIGPKGGAWVPPNGWPKLK
jgi:mono/diheme cytochrome c family protein